MMIWCDGDDFSPSMYRLYNYDEVFSIYALSWYSISVAYIV